jgi:5-formyltetrahydrofolate cyclo-ligase
MRKRRRALSQTERDAFGACLARVASREPLVRISQRIALYLPVNGEMDPRPLMDRLWSLGKVLYLPVLARFPERRLWFSIYGPGAPLADNRFGIPEPVSAHHALVSAVFLDLVLLPLVAFDAEGNRLGMGGGYYDCSLAFLKRRRHWRKPRLMGVAYEFQRIARIKSESWDVPLDAVATEQRVYRCNRGPIPAPRG